MKNKIFFRKILLSTSEIVEEAVIRYNNKEFYENSPVGLTLGLEESQNHRLPQQEEKTKDFLVNLAQNIPNFSQTEFDKIISKNLSSQQSTGLSLAYAKLLAYIKNDFTSSEFFKYINAAYNNDAVIKGDLKVISNILNGGIHANEKLAFCEFMIIPKTSNTTEGIKIVSSVYKNLEQIIKKDSKTKVVPIGREAGFVPNVIKVLDAIELVNKAIENDGNRATIAIDIAANNFSKQKDGIFVYTVDEQEYATEELVRFYVKLLKKYTNITYLEDPFHEYDKKGWKQLMQEVGDKIMIVSDDLSISQIKKLKENKGMFNASILKMNQAGNLSEFMKSFEYCRDNNIKTIVSQRSGETDSNIIAHLAFGLNSSLIKIGAPARERIVKYNELLRIHSKIID